MVDVVSDQTEISYGDTTSPAFSGDTFTDEPDIKVQGNGSQACAMSNNGTNDAWVAGTFNISGSHIRLYFNISFIANLQNQANNGIQVWATDGTNTAYWTIGGSDTYGGGWADAIVDVSSTPTSGTVNASSITQVGMRFNCSSKPRNVVNAWLDNWRFGNGITVNSDTTEAIDFTDVAVEDGLLANKYNIAELIDGVIFVKGEIILGDTGSKNCNLVSVDEQIVFPDRNVTNALYKLKTQEGTGATDIDITGLVCKTVGGSGAELDFSAAITSFSLASSTFIAMGTISFPAQGTQDGNSFTSCGNCTMQSGHSVTNINWNNSGTLTPAGASIAGGNIINNNSSTGTLVISSPSQMSQLSDINFDGNNRCINITAAGTYTFDGHQFGSNTIQVNFSGSGTCTINPTNGCNVSQANCEATGGGTITVNAVQYQFSFDVLPAITGYEWRIYTVTAIGSLVGAVEVDGEETATVSSQSFTHTYTNQPIAVQIIDDNYEESITYYTLGAANLDVDINLEFEYNA